MIKPNAAIWQRLVQVQLRLRQWMIVFISLILCAGWIGGSIAPDALAKTANDTHTHPIAIILNGQTIATEDVITRQHARFLPINGFITLLKQLGIKSEWNGALGVWSLTGNASVELALFHEGNEQTFIEWNHRPIDLTTSFQATDPLKHEMATYLPLSVLTHLLGQLGFPVTFLQSQNVLAVTAYLAQDWQVTRISPLTAGESSGVPVTVTLHDAMGNRVAGVKVQAVSSDAQMASISRSAITGGNGQAVFEVGAGKKSGTATLTFFTPGGFTHAQILVHPTSPAHIAWQGTATIPADTGASIPALAVVTDVYGNPVPGVAVNFQSGSPSLLTIGPNAISNASGVLVATSDKCGVASAPMQPNGPTGVATIQMSAAGIAPVSASVNVANPTATTSYIGLYRSNLAQNDSVYWQRASKDFYLAAQTLRNFKLSLFGNGTPPSLLSVKPGQVLYLGAFFQNAIVDTHVKWVVNSADAILSPSTAEVVNTSGSASAETFQAAVPGIYTVQAEDQGVYSVPLVITVGMKDLTSIPYAESAKSAGVLPLPSDLPKLPSQQSPGFTYTAYNPIGHWVPVEGTTSLSVDHVTVAFTSDMLADAQWNDQLPVTNGKFSGLLFDPVSGPQYVFLVPHYFQKMTIATDHNHIMQDVNSWYPITITPTPPGMKTIGLLASAHRNFNMSPKFAEVADMLLENSPTMETAMEAINNYSTESIVYNLQSDQFTANGVAPYYVWQSALQAWNTHSGVCEDYASLDASLLESVGISALTVGGVANSNWTHPNSNTTNPADSHIWVKAWDGSSWILMDPTWGTTAGTKTIGYVSNQFFTNTVALQETHAALSGQLGTWE